VYTRRVPSRRATSPRHQYPAGIRRRHLGAENWAVLATLIETCKLHGVNPEAYLADVLSKLVDNWPNRRLADLAPWAWQAAQNTRERIAAGAAPSIAEITPPTIKQAKSRCS
jgi:hypothetical protein